MKTQGETEGILCEGIGRREYLKPVRTPLLEIARPVLKTMFLNVTGIRVVSMHHDISTDSGEEAMLFALADTPNVHEPTK